MFACAKEDIKQVHTILWIWILLWLEVCMGMHILMFIILKIELSSAQILKCIEIILNLEFCI